MATSTKLQKFLAYIDSYLYSYRIKYNASPQENVEMRFLVNGTPDTLVVNCCVSEPNVTANNFWYNGTVLRKYVSDEPQTQFGFNKSYFTCYTYEDAFTSTVVSLNPPIVLTNPVTTTPTPPISGGATYVKRIGDSLLGPLFLYRHPVEDKEAATKNYIDVEISKLLTQINVNSTNIDNLVAALEILSPDTTKLDQLKARLSNLEAANIAYNNLFSNLGDSITSINLNAANLELRVLGLENRNDILDGLGAALLLVNERLDQLETAEPAYATELTHGVVKVGNGLQITETGILSTKLRSHVGEIFTTDSTPTAVSFDDQDFLPLDYLTATALTVRVVGVQVSEVHACAYTLQCLVYNGVETKLIGSILKTTIACSKPAWDVNLVVDESNRGIRINVTGTDEDIIQWKIEVEMTATRPFA